MTPEKIANMIGEIKYNNGIINENTDESLIGKRVSLYAQLFRDGEEIHNGPINGIILDLIPGHIMPVYKIKLDLIPGEKSQRIINKGQRDIISITDYIPEPVIDNRTQRQKEIDDERRALGLNS